MSLSQALGKALVSAAGRPKQAGYKETVSASFKSCLSPGSLREIGTDGAIDFFQKWSPFLCNPWIINVLRVKKNDWSLLTELVQG